MTQSVKLVMSANAELGEGPSWDAAEKRLWWVDILGKRLFEFDPVSGENRRYELPQMVGAVVPWQKRKVMLAVREGFAAFDLDTLVLELVARPEADRPNNRFNDGKCDPVGRFWAGTMSTKGEAGAGSLYRLDVDGCVYQMAKGITIANGLAWSADQQTLYFIDSSHRTVTAYDYDMNSGAIAHGKVILRTPDEMGWPDGMTIDATGMLWIAHYGGSCVARWNPNTGELLERIVLPVTQVTSCVFGGETLETLYISTATENLGPAEKAREIEAGAGGLFAVNPGVSGTPTFRYSG